MKVPRGTRVDGKADDAGVLRRRRCVCECSRREAQTVFGCVVGVSARRVCDRGVCPLGLVRPRSGCRSRCLSQAGQHAVAAAVARIRSLRGHPFGEWRVLWRACYSPIVSGVEVAPARVGCVASRSADAAHLQCVFLGSPLAPLSATNAAAAAVLVAYFFAWARCRSSRSCSERTWVIASATTRGRNLVFVCRMRVVLNDIDAINDRLTRKDGRSARRCAFAPEVNRAAGW